MQTRRNAFQILWLAIFLLLGESFVLAEQNTNPCVSEWVLEVVDLPWISGPDFKIESSQKVGRAEDNNEVLLKRVEPAPASADFSAQVKYKIEPGKKQLIDIKGCATKEAEPYIAKAHDQKWRVLEVKANPESGEGEAASFTLPQAAQGTLEFEIWLKGENPTWMSMGAFVKSIPILPVEFGVSPSAREANDAGNVEVSADSPEITIDAVFASPKLVSEEGEEGTKALEYEMAGDGSVVTWKVTGDSGASLATEESVTSGGVATVKLTLPTQAGKTFQVRAIPKKLLFGGRTFEKDDAAKISPTDTVSIVVVPGKPKTIVLDRTRTWMPADETSVTTFGAVVKDQHGNLAAAGTPVAWTLSGDATFTTPSSGGLNSGGRSTVTVRAGIDIASQQLTVKVGDDLAATAELNLKPLALEVNATDLAMLDVSEQLAGNIQRTINVKITSNDQPVPSGVPVAYTTNRGKVTGSGVTGAGGTIALLYDADGAGDGFADQVSGDNSMTYTTVIVSAGNAVELYKIPLMSSAALRVGIVNPVLIGSGEGANRQFPEGSNHTFNIDVVAYDGTKHKVPLHRITPVLIKGRPDSTVTVAVEGPGQAFLELRIAPQGNVFAQSEPHCYSVSLGPTGSKEVYLASKGGLPAEEGTKAIYEYVLTVLDGPDVATAHGRMISKDQAQLLHNFWAGLAYGKTEDGGLAAHAGNFLAGMTNYGDVRDLVLEFAKLAPGGEGEIQWSNVVFAVVGLVPGSEVIFRPFKTVADALWGAIKTCGKKISSVAPLFRRWAERIRRSARDPFEVEQFAIKEHRMLTEVANMQADVSVRLSKFLSDNETYEGLVEMVGRSGREFLAGLDEVAQTMKPESAAEVLRTFLAISKNQRGELAINALKSQGDFGKAIMTMAKCLESGVSRKSLEDALCAPAWGAIMLDGLSYTRAKLLQDMDEIITDNPTLRQSVMKFFANTSTWNRQDYGHLFHIRWAAEKTPLRGFEMGQGRLGFDPDGAKAWEVVSVKSGPGSFFKSIDNHPGGVVSGISAADGYAYQLLGNGAVAKFCVPTGLKQKLLDEVRTKLLPDGSHKYSKAAHALLTERIDELPF